MYEYVHLHKVTGAIVSLEGCLVDVLTWGNMKAIKVHMQYFRWRTVYQPVAVYIRSVDFIFKNSTLGLVHFQCATAARRFALKRNIFSELFKHGDNFLCVHYYINYDQYAIKLSI